VVTFTTYDYGQPRQEELPGTEGEKPPVISDSVIVGLDLGQRQDYTALAYVERHQVDDEPATYAVRRLRRWREVPYTAIRDELAGRLAAWKLTGRDELVLDATGVGVAVTDLFSERKRQGQIPTGLSAITITAGNSSSRVLDGWHVPKRDLIAVVAVMLEQRRIQIADDLADAVVLKGELANFRLKLTAAGNDTYSAWREAEHDDLVLAVALACWCGERPKRVNYIY